MKESGLEAEHCAIDDAVLRQVISHYTREAGVRQLERAIGRLARKVALRRVEGATEPVAVHVEDLIEWLGPERTSPEQARKNVPPGVATGLAWTESGGDVLYVEATLLPSGRGMTLTGQLGDVMQESARGGAELPVVARGRVRHRSGGIPQERRSCARSGGSDPEGRAIGRRYHGERTGFGVSQGALAIRYGDDG